MVQKFSARGIFSVLILLISFWVIVYRIDAVPMNVWDESRQANNAIEMMLSGNYAFPTYNGQPDFWNTKPHLLIAIQAFFMKILGPGLLALRLPSAIAGFITVLIWFKFIHERNGFYSAAVFVLVLLTCSGFNVYHVTRTGDYDALLVLFISLATIGIIQMENSQPELKKAIMAGLWISLAALTKSVAVLLWIPSWILLIYWQRRNLGKNIYLFSLVLFGLPLLTMLIYYGFREWLNTGYVSAVWQNEWIGRYLKPNEGHVTNFDYYFKNLWTDSFRGFILFIPLIFLLKEIRDPEKQGIRTLFIVLIFLLFISASATRISWYAAPVFPLLSWLLSMPFGINTVKKNLLFIYLAAIICMAVPGYFRNLHNNTTTHGVRAEWLLMDIDKGKKQLPEAAWLLSSYSPVADYYRKAFSIQKIAMRFLKLSDCKPGDTLIVGSEQQMEELRQKFKLRQLNYPSEEKPYWLMLVEYPAH